MNTANIATTGFAFGQRRNSVAVTGRRETLDADATLREKLLAKLENQAWWKPETSNVFVANGRVVFQGLIDREAERSAARALAQGIAGVQEVQDARVRRREWQAMA